MTTADDDTDIQGLLDELDGESSEVAPVQEEPATSVTISAPDPIHDPQQIIIDPDSESPAAAPSSNSSNSSNDVGKLIGELLADYKDRTTDIWDKINADRTLIDQYITIFTDRINTPESAKGYYVEALVSLVNTKASTSLNATKILDSVAKIVGTVKNMGVENSTNVDLEKLLEDDSGTSELGFDINNP